MIFTALCRSVHNFEKEDLDAEPQKGKPWVIESIIYGNSSKAEDGRKCLSLERIPTYLEILISRFFLYEC